MTGSALVIQLARMGDLVQSAPAIQALAAQEPDRSLDLLCAAPFAPLAALIPGVNRVIPWDGQQWRDLARRGSVTAAEAALSRIIPQAYDTVYNLNNHRRAVLTAHLLGRKVVGPGHHGPFSKELPPWAAYLRDIAVERGGNRVHLADAWCGFCGVRPPGLAPKLTVPETEWPPNLKALRMTMLSEEGKKLLVAVVVGAGDAERSVLPACWAAWINAFLSACGGGMVVLVGSGAEREVAWAIQESVSPVLAGRLWNATACTSVVQLASLLTFCQWVVGADTGPLHLGAAVGANAMGFYFGRARVHETGPYGEGHWVWQAENVRGEGFGVAVWPVAESVELLLTGTSRSVPDGWSLQRSHVDAWGVCYAAPHGAPEADARRERIWRRVDAQQVGTFCLQEQAPSAAATS